MGYLDNTAITVDAILTDIGRKKLAQGNFNPTQFALADDEINYSLYNPDHPLGTDYYGIIIENTPLTEASAVASKALQSKLVTLGRNTKRIPIITATPTSITIFDDASALVRLTTVDSGNAMLGYTVTLLNSDAASIQGDSGVPGNQTDEVPPSDNPRSSTITTKTTIYITPKRLISNAGIPIVTKIIVVGNETGGRVEISLTVQPRVR